MGEKTLRLTQMRVDLLINLLYIGRSYADDYDWPKEESEEIERMIVELACVDDEEEEEEPSGPCPSCGDLPRYSEDGDGESGPAPGGFLYRDCDCEEEMR